MLLTPPKSLRARFRQRSAFSLVEVTLALGLIAMGLVTMCGLVPIGLNSMADSQVHLVRAQILQRVAGEAQLVPFTHETEPDLVDYAATHYFYDGEGMRQAITEPNGETRFKLELTLVAPEYPGSGEAQKLSQNLITLQVLVRQMAGTVPVQEAPAEYVLHVPNQGG